MKQLVLGMVMLAGCTGEPELELDTVESSILGGTPTAMRPEIGLLQTSGGWCTATLISPRVILTAAHCIAEYGFTSPITPVAVPQNARFTITTPTGDQPFGIDRAHAFGSYPYPALFNGSAMVYDVAILRLSVAVPSNVATPAAIALAAPATGAWSTSFGFGCVDRRTLGGALVKRAREYAYGSSSLLCNGDSGGPAVYGTMGSNGAIWGVARGYWDDGTDVFANVVIHRQQIEAVMRGWIGEEEGFDRLGSDYAANTASTVGQCRQLCQNDGKCRAFTWRASDFTCWRKSAAAAPTPGVGLISGLARRLEPGIDRFGGDYRSVTASTPDACASACSADPNCQAWTHLGTSCFLKSSTPNQSPCSACTSGVVARGFEFQTDRPGGDYAAIPNVFSPASCRSECAKDMRCEAFTHGGTTCWLKNMAPNPVPAPGTFLTSGVRRGVEPESDRSAGAVLSTFTHAVMTPTLCQATCASNPICQAWTQQPVDGRTMRCVLLADVPARQFSVSAVSGVKGLEMLP